MSEQLIKTYTVKMQSGDIWIFKYNLKGILIDFKAVDGELTEKQIDFLYLKGNYPFKESHIKEWFLKYKQVHIEIGEPNIHFEVFWKLYPKNELSKKKLALERWNKLKEGEKIKLLMNLPEYKKLKAKEGTNFPYAEVFINQRWWDK
ncbi:hypothetical protein [Flavobacterium covae]|uniref:hypothetical protein n=1 Tax=Flavobacterium covae TaxID=2906076 RepID=UPI000745B626|nr:hypothetical protein [Flavobacterium covae]AMA49428.1 hypothetical protein AWN65_08145 [Flavobacterium covae]MCJ1808967.1 hypothetical protein [Flavobacterium covae]